MFKTHDLIDIFTKQPIVQNKQIGYCSLNCIALMVKAQKCEDVNGNGLL